MAWYRCGGGGIPSSLKTGMNNVLNKKFGTSTTYAPATWPDNVNLLGPLPEKTVSGAIASFSDGADDVPIKSLVCDVDANLSGVSSVTVYQIGKNLFPFPISSYWETGNISDTTGKNVLNANNTRTVGLSPIPSGTTTLYISGVSNSGSSDKFRFFWYDENKQFLGYSNYANYTQLTVYTGARFFRMRYQTASGSFSDPCIFTESGQTYEAYKSKTPITVSLGRTIYGGSVDVIAGTGTDDGIYFGDDYSQYNVTLQGINQYGIANFQIASTDRKTSGYEYNNLGLPWQTTTIANTQTEGILYNNSSNIFVRINSTTASTKEQFETWANANLKMLFEKATPETFTFQGIEMDSYYQNNNIWADAGDIQDCTYRADIALALGGG